ncbi:DUF4861 family protein [Shewanella sp. UCD-KL21]|uniref:DUF4861 family protein n=1 Tax=Shewanella sp. UCD-KL21 TaxID=1917164 RepID=UPI0009704C0C|nr:DUF4861 family protein [Shewanella sp. UCD-KL21]
MSINKFCSCVFTVLIGLTFVGCSYDKSVNNQSVNNKLDTTEANIVKPKVMAYGRFVPERSDDFAWENDKVAFRVYGPAAPLKGHASGVDAWFKKVDYPIIDKWYKAHLEGLSYHTDRGEGYDPYHTGTSRGVGSTAIWFEGKPYYSHSYKSYNIHKNKGAEVNFTLLYEWDTPLGLVNESKNISLKLGQQLFEVNSVFLLNGKAAVLPIALGVTTHDEKANVFSNPETGRISTWELIDGIGVGTGAIVEPKLVNEIKHVASDVKDESHLWIMTTSDTEGHFSYRAGFAWAGANEIIKASQWNRYLDNQ